MRIGISLGIDGAASTHRRDQPQRSRSIHIRARARESAERQHPPLGNAIENSIWAVAFFIAGIGLCRLLPEFDGPVRVVLAISITGIAAYLAFLMTIDVPMYLNRWRAEVSDGSRRMKPLEGLRDVSTRWRRDARPCRVEGRDCLDVALFQRGCLGFYTLGDRLSRYRTETTVASWSPAASAMVYRQHPVVTLHGVYSARLKAHEA